MLKKRIAMGIMASLLACSFIAGCGGGNKGGDAAPPKPKPVAEDLKDLPSKDLKIGTKTYKLYSLKNDAKLRLENVYSKGMRIAVADKYMVYANVKNKLVQMKWEKDALMLINDKVDDLGGNSKVSTDKKGVFYDNKKMKLTYFDGDTNRIDQAQNRFNHLVVIPQGAADKALTWMVQGDISKVNLRDGYKVGQTIGVVRKESRARDAADKDKIAIPESVIADTNGDFYVGGHARVQNDDVGLAFAYDTNGKQKRMYGKERRNDKDVMYTVTDMALTNDYLVVSDSSATKSQLLFYKKSLGSLAQAISFKELTGKEDTLVGACVNLATMPENRVLVVLSRGRRDVDDEIFVLQL